MSDYDGSGDASGDDDRVMEWEFGLPDVDDLTPLSHQLIPMELASAFRIMPEPYRNSVDVNNASQTTLSGLRGGQSRARPSSNNFNIMSFNEDRARDSAAVEADEADLITGDPSDSRKLRRIDSGPEDADSAMLLENGNDDPSASASKRPRLVWTPQLHKRFVDVVSHMGLKNAVPKTIMQMMNVEGLTRENVASHLQKYRLYLKRMQGGSSEGPSPSDNVFASKPAAKQNLQHDSGGGGGSGQGHSNGHVPMPIPMQFTPQMMQMQMQMPVLGMNYAHGHMGMPMGHPAGPGGAYHGFESHPFNMMQQSDWSGNNFGYRHGGPSNE